MNRKLAKILLPIQGKTQDAKRRATRKVEKEVPGSLYKIQKMIFIRILNQIHNFSSYNAHGAGKKSNQSALNQFIKSESFGEEQQSIQSPKLMNAAIGENNMPTTSTQMGSSVINEEMVQRQMAALMTAALGHQTSQMGLGPPPNLSTPPPGSI